MRRALCLAGLCLLSCAAPARRMAQPLGMGHALILDGQGRGRGKGGWYSSDDPFRLGPYRVRKVHRKIYSAESDPGPPTPFHWKSRVSKVAWASAGYTYRFVDSATVWEGECDYRDSTRSTYRRDWYLDYGGLNLWTLDSAARKTRLDCRCATGGRESRLGMAQDPQGAWSGILVPADTAYRVVPVDKYEDGSEALGAIGYKFSAPDGARGAVETMRPGRVWLSPDLSGAERAPSACLLAGLILYTGPN